MKTAEIRTDVNGGPVAAVRSRTPRSTRMSASPHIVHVEDNPVDARLFERAVAAATPDTRIMWLRDGESAIAELERLAQPEAGLPALVVLDVKLPKVVGFDVLSYIRNSPKLSAVPVTMLTSSSQIADVVEAYTRGVNSFLSKPPTYGGLKEVVSHLVPYWLTHNRRVLSPASAR